MVEGEEERARRGGREVEREEGKKNGMPLRSSDPSGLAPCERWVTVTRVDQCWMGRGTQAISASDSDQGPTHGWPGTGGHGRRASQPRLEQVGKGCKGWIVRLGPGL